jgi:hypothetical protein
LSEKGLIPMPDGERKKFQADAAALKVFSCDQLK